MHIPQRVVQLAKFVVALCLRASGLLALVRRRRAASGQIAVLWLHRVDGSPDARLPMAVPPDAFRAIVRRLARSYRVGSFSGSMARAREGPEGRPLVAITFDDGYEDNAKIAWPILREAGSSATFLVTTSFVDGERPLWWEIVAARHAAASGEEPFPLSAAGEATYGAAEAELAALKELPNDERERRVEAARTALERLGASGRLPRALTWGDVGRLRDEGAEIGGHTRGHAILPRCGDDELRTEIGCRDEITRRLGETPTTFAYPNGSYDGRVARVVRDAGYEHALTTHKGWYTPGRCDPLAVPRIGISEPRYSLDGRSVSWTLFEAEMLGAFELPRRLVGRLFGRRERHAPARGA